MKWYPEFVGMILLELADMFEILGEYDYAKNCLKLIITQYKDDSIERAIAEDELTLYARFSPPFPLGFPRWWDKVSPTPEWLEKIDISLPAFTCWKDRYLWKRQESMIQK